MQKQKKRISSFHIQKVTKFKRYIFLPNTTEHLDIMDIMTSSPVKKTPNISVILLSARQLWFKVRDQSSASSQYPLHQSCEGCFCEIVEHGTELRNRFHLKGNYSMGSIHGELLWTKKPFKDGSATQAVYCYKPFPPTGDAVAKDKASLVHFTPDTRI